MPHGFQIAGVSAIRSWFAVTEDGTIAGYASFGDWRAFDGYRHTVEHSVYVEKNQRGGGIGKLLMQALIERAGRPAASM